MSIYWEDEQLWSKSSCSPSCWEGDFDNSAVGLKDAKWPHKLQSALLNFKMGTSWDILCPLCFSMFVKCQLHIFSTIGIFHYRNGNSTMFIRSISLGAVVRMALPPVPPGGRCFPASTSTPSATFPRFAEFEQRRGKERRNRAEVHSVIRVEFFPGIAARPEFGICEVTHMNHMIATLSHPILGLC